MDPEFGLDLDAIFNMIGEADVFVVRFAAIEQRLAPHPPASGLQPQYDVCPTQPEAKDLQVLPHSSVVKVCLSPTNKVAYSIFPHSRTAKAISVINLLNIIGLC